MKSGSGKLTQLQILLGIQFLVLIIPELLFDLFSDGRLLVPYEILSFSVEDRFSDLAFLNRITFDSRLTINPPNYPPGALYIHFVLARLKISEEVLLIFFFGYLALFMFRGFEMIFRMQGISKPRVKAIIAAGSIQPLWYAWDRGSTDLIIASVILFGLNIGTRWPNSRVLILAASFIYKPYLCALATFKRSPKEDDQLQECSNDRNKLITKALAIGSVLYVIAYASSTIFNPVAAKITSIEGGSHLAGWLNLQNPELHRYQSAGSISVFSVFPVENEKLIAVLLCGILSVLAIGLALSAIYVMFRNRQKQIMFELSPVSQLSVLMALLPVSPGYRLVVIWVIAMHIVRSELLGGGQQMLSRSSNRVLCLLIVASLGFTFSVQLRSFYWLEVIGKFIAVLATLSIAFVIETAQHQRR